MPALVHALMCFQVAFWFAIMAAVLSGVWMIITLIATMILFTVHDKEGNGFSIPTW